MVDAYATWFRKAISKVKIVKILLAQMQVIDFIAGLWINLAIITNGLNLIDLDKVEEMIKNIENVSLINKNVIAATINLAVAEVKELKA